ncbi:protein patched homolog 1-like isoform X1 [Ostrea edulis]|uniref:protein patched homolog 1-like isoform X1 n=1 Tax=Ostrea edulis TaxID=37623 RepID=UPI0024AFADCD|nr:protein patched homolog 1-like isoform X1 [Ostrea edulis]
MQQKPDSNESTRRYSCLRKVSHGIIWSLETAFYHLGQFVGTYPVLTIVLSFVICGIASLGMVNFKETDITEKLWVPSYSRIQDEKKWMMENFPPDTRFAKIIAVENNILSPRSLSAMLDLYNKAISFHENGYSYNHMCLRVGFHCRVSSILEIWSYNKSTIAHLTYDGILRDINSIKYSPMYHNRLDVTTMLGKVLFDTDGNIIAAEVASILFLLKDEEEMRPAAMKWETEVIQLVQKGHPHLKETYIYATRSFDDEGYGAVNEDINLLSVGICIVLIFVIITLGRFNLVEHKLLLSLAGLLSVGMSIGFAYGLATTFGVIYGPVHAIMPFLLLGIGVDDMFVIVEAWKNLTPKEQQLPLPKQVAMTMKHAGVSVTVTSVTDIVAFAIGASTVIPGLSAFCIDAALGILALFILQSTFFVACLTLDQKRIEAQRDAILCCVAYKSFEPNKCSQKNFLALAFKKYLGPFFMRTPVKVIVMIVTFSLLGVNIYGFYHLKQDFDLVMYIPSDSYAHQFAKAQEKYFPDRGVEVNVYCGDIHYGSSQKILNEMLAKIGSDPGVENGTVISWFPAFEAWLRSLNNSKLAKYNHYPYDELEFDSLALRFVEQTPVGRAFRRFMKFDKTINPPILKAMYFSLRHTSQSNSQAEIDAMENLRKITDNAGLPVGMCFPYCPEYLTYETNKVLQVELYRNLALAGACVFFVTLILIANVLTSMIVFTCVIFTLVDVAGTMYFWGVTIDTASSILLTLCVGLAVDYSAHIGHTFMTVSGSKKERPVMALTEIGPAVFNGGFSTFLAFVLLANSNSYGFSLFFRVFFTVVVFGLFHGLVYLPVVLSWLGPEPYDTNSVHKSVPEKQFNGHLEGPVSQNQDTENGETELSPCIKAEETNQV